MDVNVPVTRDQSCILEYLFEQGKAVLLAPVPAYVCQFTDQTQVLLEIADLQQKGLLTTVEIDGENHLKLTADGTQWYRYWDSM